MGRIASQVLRLQGIESWQEGCISPREHEAEVVVSDIDSSKIPVFVPEEVNDIYRLEYEDDQHRISDVSELLKLVGSPGKISSNVSKVAWDLDASLT